MDKFDLNNKALNLRKDLNIGFLSSIDVNQIVNRIKNLTLIYYPLRNNIGGANINGENSSIIVINSNLTLGHQRFIFAHELYHLFFDKERGNSVCQSNLNKRDEIEKEADYFASYFLLPSIITQDLKKKDRIFSIRDILNIEQQFGISRSALLKRLKEENIITDKELKQFSKDIIRNARILGYNDELYLPSLKEQKFKVFGYFISIANDLHEAGIISSSKYEELLLHAFREDIVFGELDGNSEEDENYLEILES